MGRFSRRRLPQAVLDRIGLEPGERVIAWGSGPGGLDPAVPNHVLATNLALLLEQPAMRIGWDRIARAQWDDPVLDIVLVADGSERPPLVRIAVDSAADLPEAVRALVTESVVVSERLDLRPGGALAVARSNPRDGSVRWTVAFDAGLDPADPDVRARADAALASLRASLGI